MSASDPTAAVQPAPLTAERPHLQARAAMWLTLRRVTVLAALTDEGWRRQLADQGMRVTGRPGRELSALMRREQSVWARLIERAKITVH